MAFHGASLRAEGVSAEAMDNVEDLQSSLDLSAQEESLLGFALMAKADPHAITDDMMSELRRVGVTDAQLVETLEVMSIAHTFNTLAHALHIEAD